MTEYNQARKVANLLEAIAEPTRLHILWQLAKGPLNVGKLADATKIRMVNMSHHLGVMKNAGVLEDTRDGRNVIYKLNPEYFTAGTSDDVLGVLALGNFRVLLRAKPEKPLAPPKARVRRKYTRRS